MRHVNWELALRNAGGNEEILQGVLEDCRSEAPRLLQQLGQALEGGDLAAGRRAAHTLRAFRRLLGAEAAGTAAEQIESLIGNGEITAARELLAGLERDVSAVVAEVEARLHGNERVEE
jgi:HPt (histidine-containing phosphotransfer) domain-containing protein